MKSARNRLGERSPARGERSFVRTILPYFNLMLAVGLTLGLVGVTHRLVLEETEKRALELELARTQSEVEELERDHGEKIAGLVESGETERDDRRAEVTAYSTMIGEMESRLHHIEDRQRSREKGTQSAFRAELEELQTRLRDELRRTRPMCEVFKEFEKRYHRGVVLIYTEFDYRKKRGGDGPRSVTGWGSGFFVSDKGYIVTNKHVIQPWKFDADLAAMVALGEIVIDESSLKICCWESGTRAIADDGEPIFANGYNTSPDASLEIFAVAPDSMSQRDLDLGSFSPNYTVHRLDDNDLVILRARGEDFVTLPIASRAERDCTTKLDPVMALGFPRGQNGLERDRAETSPSIGTIRKVENTIHVTASIIPGNSGGPLIGADGKVVGIVTRVYSETLGICLKIDHALRLIKSQEAALAAAPAPPGLTAPDDHAAVASQSR